MALSFRRIVDWSRLKGKPRLPRPHNIDAAEFHPNFTKWFNSLPFGIQRISDAPDFDDLKDLIDKKISDRQFTFSLIFNSIIGSPSDGQTLYRETWRRTERTTLKELFVRVRGSLPSSDMSVEATKTAPDGTSTTLGTVTIPASTAWDTAKITWDYSLDTNPAGFDIEMRESTDTWSNAFTPTDANGDDATDLSGSARSFEVDKSNSGLTDNTDYEARVITKDSVGGAKTSSGSPSATSPDSSSEDVDRGVVDLTDHVIERGDDYQVTITSAGSAGETEIIGR